MASYEEIVEFYAQSVCDRSYYYAVGDVLTEEERLGKGREIITEVCEEGKTRWLADVRKRLLEMDGGRRIMTVFSDMKGELTDVPLGVFSRCHIPKDRICVALTCQDCILSITDEHGIELRYMSHITKRCE